MVLGVNLVDFDVGHADFSESRLGARPSGTGCRVSRPSSGASDESGRLPLEERSPCERQGVQLFISAVVNGHVTSPGPVDPLAGHSGIRLQAKEENACVSLVELGLKILTIKIIACFAVFAFD
jgi:hypothetical protein